MKKMLLILSLILTNLGPAWANEDEPILALRCECFQLVPFEAYGIYVIESKASGEYWFRMGTTQYEEAACRQAIVNDEICQSFKN